MTNTHDCAVAWCSGNPKAAYAALADTDRMMQTDGVRYAALVVLGCHDPNFASELVRDLLENRQTRGLDAVVIGNQNAIQHSAAPRMRSPNLYPSGAAGGGA